MTMDAEVRTGRRAFIAGGLGLSLASAAGITPAAAGRTSWRDDHVQAVGAKLRYRDFGGSGRAVVFLHPSTGSVDVWEPQLTAFAAEGYRAIAYSRRAYRGSEAGNPADPRTAVEDLLRLLDGLGVDRCHAVASGAGGFVLADLALSAPDRLASMTIAASTLNLTGPEMTRMNDALRIPNFFGLPAHFLELSPTYRVREPEGVRRWLAIEHDALQSPALRFQPSVTPVTLDALGRLSIPALFIAGDADLISPPPMMELFQRHVRSSRLSIMPGCGHACAWERPEEFNRAIFGFLAAL